MLYTEVVQAAVDPGLVLRVRVAAVVAAAAVLSEPDTTTNHVARLAWAKTVMENPVAAGASMMWPVLASNVAVPLASVLAASDSTVQSAVNAAVDIFAQ